MAKEVVAQNGWTVVHIDLEAHVRLIVEKSVQAQGFGYRGFELSADAISHLRAMPDTDRSHVVVVVELMGLYGKEDNWAFLQDMKDATLRDIPIMVLTLFCQDADVFRGWHSGVDCYLTKPFNKMEVVAFIKRIIERLESSREAPVPA